MEANSASNGSTGGLISTALPSWRLALCAAAVALLAAVLVHLGGNLLRAASEFPGNVVGAGAAEAERLAEDCSHGSVTSCVLGGGGVLAALAYVMSYVWPKLNRYKLKAAQELRSRLAAKSETEIGRETLGEAGPQAEKAVRDLEVRSGRAPTEREIALLRDLVFVDVAEKQFRREAQSLRAEERAKRFEEARAATEAVRAAARESFQEEGGGGEKDTDLSAVEEAAAHALPER